MKAGTWFGAMPANVSVSERANVTAGLAKLVDEVNQYAAVIHSATAAATCGSGARDESRMVSSRPNVAMTSPRYSPTLPRTRALLCSSGSPNIACAATTPTHAPANWAAALGDRLFQRQGTADRGRTRYGRIEMRPRDRREDRDQREKPGAGRDRRSRGAQPRHCRPTSCSPMIPEPTTIASSNAVPSASAPTRRITARVSDLPAVCCSAAMRSSASSGRLGQQRDALLEHRERFHEGGALRFVVAGRPPPGPRRPSAR